MSEYMNTAFRTVKMFYSMVVDIMVPTLCVIRSHKKKIESSPKMIFPQGMVTTTVLPTAHTISNNSMSTCDMGKLEHQCSYQLYYNSWCTGQGF